MARFYSENGMFANKLIQTDRLGRGAKTFALGNGAY
jgi:hypothetical protein